MFAGASTFCVGVLDEQYPIDRSTNKVEAVSDWIVEIQRFVWNPRNPEHSQVGLSISECSGVALPSDWNLAAHSISTPERLNYNKKESCIFSLSNFNCKFLMFFNKVKICRWERVFAYPRGELTIGNSWFLYKCLFCIERNNAYMYIISISL